MEYLHVKNIEKYHPGYRDRKLHWCKTFFSMLNSDPDFMLLDEIDKWRFTAFIMLELQIQKPVPLNEKFLSMKGFDFKKRNMSLTVNMLHNFIDIVTGLGENATNPLRREEKRREEKSREDSQTAFDTYQKEVLELWNAFCIKHPILSKIKELSGKRRISLKNRYEIESFRDFSAILSALEKQPFCLGKNDRNWKVSFDWLIDNDTNYLKILEMKYQDKDFSKEESLYKPTDPDCVICGGTGFVYVQSESGNRVCSCRIKSKAFAGQKV